VYFCAATNTTVRSCCDDCWNPSGLSASVGSVGDAYDNALAESIIGLFKTEVINRHGPFKTLTEVEFALMEWCDWYNNARLHSRLDYLTPAEYEAAYYAQQPPRRPARV
jgi:putative transposase